MNKTFLKYSLGAQKGKDSMSSSSSNSDDLHNATFSEDEDQKGHSSVSPGKKKRPKTLDSARSNERTKGKTPTNELDPAK